MTMSFISVTVSARVKHGTALVHHRNEAGDPHLERRGAVDAAMADAEGTPPRGAFM